MSQPPPHPMQPLVRDEHGTIRFRENKIVTYLLDQGPFDLNNLAVLPFDREDHEQLSQLLGYSVSAFGDSSHVSSRACQRADRAAEQLRHEKTDTATPEEVDGNLRIAVAMLATELEKQFGDPSAREVLERPVVADSVRSARAYLQDAIGTRSGSAAGETE